MSDMTIDIDQFAASVESILGKMSADVVEASNKATAQSVRQGAKFVKEHAKNGGVHKWSQEYVDGFASHVNKTGVISEGEVGNRNKPGLVHLLEKGHATLTGRRTRAFPHMAPAFEEMQKDYIERMEKYVGGAL